MITILQCHIYALAKQDSISLELCQFKDETKDAIRKTREGLECLNSSLKTCQIPLQLMQHKSTMLTEMQNDVPSRTIEESINHHRVRMDDMNIQTTNEIKRVIQLVSSDQKEEEHFKSNHFREVLERFRD